MKNLLLFLLLTFPLTLVSQTLQRVEPLTKAEIVELQLAADRVSQAQLHEREVQQSIAHNHKMSEEHWMEWSSWYKFDGDFILQYHESMMANGLVFTSATPTVVHPTGLVRVSQ